MFLVIDIILVAVFALFVYTAMKKGFMLSLLEFLAVIISFVLAYSLSPVVAEAAYDGFVEKQLVESVEDKIDENFSLEETGEQTEQLLDAIPDYMVVFAESFGISVNDIKHDLAKEDLSNENLATELVENIAQPVAIGALTVVSFLILAVVLQIILKVLARLISGVFKLPVIGSANKILGAILGACKGIVVVIFICTVLTVVFSSGDNEIADAVNDSLVINALDEINPFIKSLKDSF